MSSLPGISSIDHASGVVSKVSGSLSASTAQITDLLSQWDEQSSSTTGPRASLFEGPDGKGLPLLVEVLALCGLCLFAWIVVKLLWLSKIEFLQAAIRPRDLDDRYRVEAPSRFPLPYLMAPILPNRLWLQTKMDQIEEISLDYIAYLLFLRCCVHVLLFWSCAAIFLILIDLNYNYRKNPLLIETSVFGVVSNSTMTGTNSTIESQDGILDFATIQFIEGSTLFWHVGVTYYNTVSALLVIWRYQKTLLALRTRYLTNEASKRSKWILLIGADSKYFMPNSQVFEGMPKERYEIMQECSENNEKLVKKIEAGLQLVSEMNPQEDPNALCKELSEVLKSLAKLKANKRSLQTLDQTTKSKAGYSLRYFESALDAREAYKIARTNKDRQIPKRNIILGPASFDIHWQNLTGKWSTSMEDVRDGGRHCLLSAGLVVLCFLYTAVIIALSFLSSLASWQTIWPGVHNFAQTDFGSVFIVILTDFLPPLLIAACRLMMPTLIKRVAILRKPISYSKGDKDLVSWLFAALIIANLFLFTSASVFWKIWVDIRSEQKITDAVADIATLPTKLVEGYLAASRFWLTWFPSTVLSSIVVHLQIVRLVKRIWAKIRHTRNVTLREQRTYCAPDSSYPLGDRASNMLLMAAVCCAYAPLAPTVVLIGMLAILFETLLIGSELAHLYVAYESDAGGKLWNTLQNRLLFCLAVIQPAVAAAVCGLKMNWRASLTLLPAPFLVCLATAHFNYNPFCPFGSNSRGTSFYNDFQFGLSEEDEIDSESTYENVNGSFDKKLSDCPPTYQASQKAILLDGLSLKGSQTKYNSSYISNGEPDEKPSFSRVFTELWIEPTISAEVAIRILNVISLQPHLEMYMFKSSVSDVHISIENWSDSIKPGHVAVSNLMSNSRYGSRQLYVVPRMTVPLNRGWA